MWLQTDRFSIKGEMFSKHIRRAVSKASRLVFDIETRSFRTADYTERI